MISARPTRTLALGMFLTLVAPAPASAQATQEFDDGFGLWRYSPNRIGRSRTAGWKTVSNAGEKAARNSPTGSKHTYYWKLSKVVDLTELERPALELKYDFRGHRYSYFRVQVGDRDARRLSDFTTLLEETEASGVTTARVDLSPFAGDVVRLRLLLRKPSKTVEKKIGLYVHRLEISASTPVKLEECVPYARGLYRHWMDANSDCQDTRQETLVENSTGTLSYLDENECRVAAGDWHDPYTGAVFVNPIHMDVDHVVPLKEAHESGAWAWDADRRAAYANELLLGGHLLPVQASANRKKGAKDPAEWLPENEGFIEDYARMWIAVKLAWDLTADPAELAALRDILGDEDIVYPTEAAEVECQAL